jgi:myo-inositol-1(or 4)-monophosphatase
MIGLLHGTQPIAAGIALPAFNTICTAGLGEGTWNERGRLAVLDTIDLDNALIAYGIDGRREAPEVTRDECSLIAELVLNCRNLRTSNSAFDTVMVAEGRYGAVLNQTSKIWDNVAPQLVIEEAGGLYTTLEGHRIDYTAALSDSDSPNFTFCAAAPRLHAQLQALIQRMARRDWRMHQEMSLTGAARRTTQLRCSDTLFY